MTKLARMGIVVTLALAPAVVATAQRNASFHITGAGGVPCGEMTHNLRTDRSSWEAFYASYVQGFISGANFVSYLSSQQNTDVGSTIAPEALFASIEQYCAQNPSRGMHAAVESVYSQLAAR